MPKQSLWQQYSGIRSLLAITEFLFFFFVVLACHLLVLDEFDQLLSSFFIHCPHTKQCTVVDKSLRNQEIKSWKCRDSNPGRLGEKRECYADPLTELLYNKASIQKMLFHLFFHFLFDFLDKSRSEDIWKLEQQQQHQFIYSLVKYCQCFHHLQMGLRAEKKL